VQFGKKFRFKASEEKMLRVAVYSFLLCLIVLTVYVRIQKPPEEPEDDTGINQASSAVPPHHQQPPPSVIQNPDHEPLPGISPESPSITGDNRVLPGNNELLLMANRKFREGDYGEAAVLFKELAETDKRALPAAGMSLFRLGKYQAAIEYFIMALDADGSDFASRKALAFSYYKLDDLKRSIEHAGNGLSLVPDPELQALFDRLLKEENIQRNFIAESTPNFKVIFDGYEHGNINREVIRILEDAYRLVGKEMDYFPPHSITVILNTKRDFFDTTGAPHWSGGIYDGKIRIPIRGAEKQSDLLKKVLFHEYTHAVVHSITRNCPRWIDEGLAEYFSAGYNKKIGQLIPLRNLENSFSGLTERNVRIAYQQSYSAVSYLIERYGIYRVKKMLESLSAGNDTDNAFRDAFSKSYTEFIREWGQP
jgi:tetratricopeptide (TPR) repeat protein